MDTTDTLIPVSYELLEKCLATVQTFLMAGGPRGPLEEIEHDLIVVMNEDGAAEEDRRNRTPDAKLSEFEREDHPDEVAKNQRREGA